MSPVPSEGGDFSTLWRLCIESPSQPKLASSLHNKRLSYWRLTGFGRNDGRGARRHRHLERRIYEKIISRCFILLPLAGEVPRSGKGGGERSEPFTGMLIMLYDAESQSRNADFISIAAGRQSTTLGPKGRRPLSEANTTLLHNLRRSRAPFFIICARRALPQSSGPKAPSNLRTLRPPGRSILRTFPCIEKPHSCLSRLLNIVTVHDIL